MEQLPNGLTLELTEGSFPLSTDSMVLSHFIKLPKKARVLDFGSSCGTLGLLMCALNDSCQITGIEIDQKAHEAALHNIRRNRLQERMTNICADLRCLPQEFIGYFDCCISNPPYFSGGPASRSHPIARREDHCSPGELFHSCAKALKYGGDFFLVHKPERLAELIACAAKEGLEAKRVQLVRHREGGNITLILLHFRKGGKPGLKWEEIALHDAEGNRTETYQKIYHIQEG